MNSFFLRHLPALRSRITSTNLGILFSSAASSSQQPYVKKSSFNKSNIVEPEAYEIGERRKFVVENISNSIDDLTRMTFAVIYIQRKQYKVTQDDLIHVEHNIPLDVGEEIVLEKILMIGNTEFTLIGRPLLDPKFAYIRATVIEKTTTSPDVQYDYRKNSIHNPVWLSHELTVLRINHIYLDKMLLGTT